MADPRRATGASTGEGEPPQPDRARGAAERPLRVILTVLTLCAVAALVGALGLRVLLSAFDHELDEADRARLLTARDLAPLGVTFDPAHETFVRHLPRLGGWYDAVAYAYEAEDLRLEVDLYRDPWPQSVRQFVRSRRVGATFAGQEVREVFGVLEPCPEGWAWGDESWCALEHAPRMGLLVARGDRTAVSVHWVIRAEVDEAAWLALLHARLEEMAGR